MVPGDSAEIPKKLGPGGHCLHPPVRQLPFLGHQNPQEGGQSLSCRAQVSHGVSFRRQGRAYSEPGVRWRGEVS